MKRKPNTLFPIELSILSGAVEFLRSGDGEFHGYLIAKALQDEAGARRLTGHGTLYRALERLEKMGFLASRWEASEVAAGEERPRRRLYHITATGQQAVATGMPAAATTAEPLKQRVATS
jgi:DNA-binding PadR family transcriptional regulator